MVFLCLVTFVFWRLIFSQYTFNGHEIRIEMISFEDAMQFFKEANGSEKSAFTKAELDSNIDYLGKIALEDGLSEDQIDEIVRFLTTKKISDHASNRIFNILIPQTTVSKYCMEEILLWLFKKSGNFNLPPGLGRTCVHWLAGVTFFELAETSVINAHYYPFLFMLKKPFMESSVCRLLCLISKPEDANRWVVQQILKISNSSNPKSNAHALLSLLKSYNPKVVPDFVCPANFQYQTKSMDEILKKAYERKLNSVGQTRTSSSSHHRKNLKIFDGEGLKSNNLLPFPRYAVNDNKYAGQKLKLLFDFKAGNSLEIPPFKLEAPAEILSIFGNIKGYHVLAFGDFALKSRFLNKLDHTLYKVFLLKEKVYTTNEKIFFLNSIMNLQQYIQQSIPAVKKFLFLYLPIWDGYEFRKKILGLLEWTELSETDLEKQLFPWLRQIFLSSEIDGRVLIIKTLRKLMRNMFVMSKRVGDCFRGEFQNINSLKSIEDIGAFGSELISIGLIWNRETNTRIILTSALDFYETSQAVEQVGDLPLIIVMPPALVYNCLFSGSRVCLSRLCSILVRLLEVSVERLHLLGVFEDYDVEVEKLNIYILDCYRCLWNKFNFQEEKGSFVFQHQSFCSKFLYLKEKHGNLVNRILSLQYNSTFWDPKAKRSFEAVLSRLTEDFPWVVKLKELVEARFHLECQ